MSTLLSTRNLSFHPGHTPLLTDISVALNQGEKIGLIGHNGCGKSTLMKLLSGQLTPDEGTITPANRVIMAYIEQHLPESLNTLSLADAVLEKLPAELHLSEMWRAEMLLTEMGFDPVQWQLPVTALSGGQHTRLLLARALISQPDLLLLDEPSNHLDLPTILWLEQFLKNWRGSFILVSHDNALLDHVTNCTWVLRDGNVSVFRLPCTQAREALAQQDESDEHRHNAQQKEIDRIAVSAKRLAIWGKVYDNEALSRKAKQMEKQIDRLQDDQVELAIGSQWQLKLTGDTLRADRLCSFNQLSVIPADNCPPLYVTDNVSVKSGDRIAVMGANGTGKSSLLRMIWSQSQKPEVTLPDSPLVLHPRVHLGYYDQKLVQLNDSDSLMDALKPFARLIDEQRKMALISAGFPYLRHQQTVSALSGGERARLLFVGLSLANYSLLILDEPTNHLDMDGKLALAEEISRFEGGLILVSHDRELIEKSCNRFWYIDGNRLTEYHDLDQVYDAIRALNADSGTGNSVLPAVPEPSVPVSDEEDSLAALITLEEKLAADLQRKPAHQKPVLQQQWREQIAQLRDELGL
ncbi:ABC-F family ATP-binding cassette domain-containing protein [Morganella morganii]|uniref:ABC-F family ATP-binding cassette domain-containing protein n=1 Tax=Morganella morganii TaxID=582 RepID=A0AAE4FBE3_MORMO|nr:ABC-F family ATP-binding cassette domain-containing protein [Morganella morganii]EJG2204603.1 ABC-F family ATP-binding cassette domain-containing protein [Morganella morganii]ELN8408039.1 ABC-F family ATP-binding cassette domain-containing protein [Morganella morganii]MBT0333969.1 ABC-F family ATP-binding cassette domain-containing protein [Morganella morganii subsp. morganii]MBT0398521.1 ABC-F family ATP-binding cassette domain-containing protein [Morganella morganii subsp. morganii]MBX934